MNIDNEILTLAIPNLNSVGRSSFGIHMIDNVIRNGGKIVFLDMGAKPDIEKLIEIYGRAK